MKLRIVPSIALLAGLAAGLCAQVSAPKLGLARYADRTVRRVYGLESNLLVDSELLSAADAVSFSDVGGLVSTGGRIQLITPDGVAVAEYDSREAAPVLNIDSGLTTAIAWLPSRDSIVYWNGTAFVGVAVFSGDLPGKVTSVQATGGGLAKLLANNASGDVFVVTVSLESGHVVSVDLLPGVKGPAFQQYSFVVSHDAGGLHVTAADGAVRTVPLAAPDLAFERMSSDWLHLSSRSTAQDWILHLNPVALHLSQLPGPRSQAHMAPRPVRPAEVAR
jgi:hypothetical protein